MLKITYHPKGTLNNLFNYAQLTNHFTIYKRYRRSDSDSDSDSSQGKLKKLKQQEQHAQLSKDQKLSSVMHKLHITQEERIKKLKKALDQGANVNFQSADYDYNSPLHIAVQQGEQEVVKFLLERGADINIKNGEGHIPIELFNKKRKSNGKIKHPEIYNLLKEHADARQRAPAVQSTGVAGGSGTSVNVPSQSGSAVLSASMDYIAGGLKQTLHGTAYQLQLLMLFMKRSLDKGYAFHLATEMTAAEKFDDVVLRYQEGRQWHYRFLQAKHRQDERKQITLNDLINNTEGDFSLLKYFSSYLKIKKQNAFKGHVQDFILCTNIGLDADLLNNDRTFEIAEITTQDAILEIKNLAKTPHRYRLKINKASDFYQQLKESPDAHRLAQTLIDRMGRGRLDLTVDILKRYHKGLAQEIIDVQNKQFYSQFISGKGLSPSAQAFRQVFTQHALKNSVYQNSPDKLWNALEDKTLSLSQSFGVGAGQQTLPHDHPVSESDITNFFSKFTLAVNQPNETQLRKILADEIGAKHQINLLDSDLVADHIQRKMLDWFKEQQGRFLSGMEGQQFFQQTLEKIDTLIAIGFSIELSAQLKAHTIGFAQTPLERLQLAVENAQIRILHLVTPENPRLELIKVYQLLQTLPQYQQQDSVLFTTLSTLQGEETQQRLISAFNAKKSHPLLVIECSGKTAGDTVKLVEQLTSTLLKHPDKKIIITAPEKHPLAVKLNDTPLTYHSFFDASHFNDLTPDAQATLLEKTVTFQGKAVALKQLVGGDHPALPFSLLMALIDNVPVQIGSALSPTQSELGGYYIERHMASTLIKRTIIDEQKSNPKAFTDHITDNEVSFQALCQQHPGGNVHWLQPMSSGALVWRQSQGEVTSLLPYIEYNVVSAAKAEERVTELAQQVNQHQFIILSAPAGMGKSTFLTHTAQELKKQQPEAWVISIDLKHQTEALQSLHNEITSGKDPLSTVMTLIAKSPLQLTTPFEQQLLLQALQPDSHSKVILLLDGFNEISPTHQAPALTLLKSLQQSKGAQVWVSTQPHLAEVLAQHCQQLPFALVPLTLSEQVEYVTRYCASNSIPLTPAQRQELTDELLLLTQKPAEALLTDNPLHLQMLAEIFSRQRVSNPTLSLTEFIHFDKLRLYQKSIETKYDIFINKGSEAKHQQNKVTNNDISIKQNHLRLALILLFPEQRNVFLTALSLNAISQLNPEELARYGMVNVVGNTPQFIHQTYAEYFVAETLFNKVVNNPPSAALADLLLCEVLSQEAQQGVNAFLELWLAKEGGQISQPSRLLYGKRLRALHTGAWRLYQPGWAERGYLLHQRVLHPAARNGHQHILHFLFSSLKTVSALETLQALLAAQDLSGNTPLHMAAEWGQGKAVAVLLQGMMDLSSESAYQILQEGNHQGQSVLHLSVEEGGTEISEQLLQWSKQKCSPEQFKKLLLQKNRQMQTSFTLSILEEHPQITANLLQWYERIGIDTQHVVAEVLVNTNTYGKTCYELATQAPSSQALENALRWITGRIHALSTQTPTEMPYTIAKALNRLYTIGQGQTSPFVKLLSSAESALPPLHLAALQGDTAQVQQQPSDALFTHASAFELTPLHLAVLHGQEEGVQQILRFTQQFAPEKFLELLNMQDQFGQTAFHLAALNGHIEITMQLMVDAARINTEALIHLLEVQNGFGQTSLHLAIASQEARLVQKILIQAGQLGELTLAKQLLTPDQYAQTPLQLAIVDHQKDSFELLLNSSNGLTISKLRQFLFTTSIQETTSLHLAIVNSTVKMVKQLLICADEGHLLEEVVLASDVDGNSPLHLSILEEKSEMGECLLKYVSKSGLQSITPKMLLAKNHQGYTPLHLAILYKKEEVIEQILVESKRLGAAVLGEVLLTRNSQGNTALHLAAEVNPSIINQLLEPLENVPSDTVKALLLTPNDADETLLYHLFNSHYYVEKSLVDKIARLMRQKLSLLEQQQMLSRLFEGNLLNSRLELESVTALTLHLQEVQAALTTLSPISVASLSDVLQHSRTLHLSLEPCSSGSWRTKRAASQCVEAATPTEELFPYQPLEESASIEQVQASHDYFQFALALYYQDGRDPRENVEQLLHYQRTLGTLLSEGEENHSPREIDILRNHYQQAQQFYAAFPKEQLFNPITQPLARFPLSTEKRQIWLVENGRYTLSILWDGTHPALYSPDLNYQHLLYAKPGVTRAQIEAFAHAFFQWRSGSSDYNAWTLKELLPQAALQKMSQSNFGQPSKVLPDSGLLAHSGSQIEGVPIKALQKLIRVHGKPVALAALHADFLRLKRENIQLHIESLHQVLATLSIDEQCNLVSVVRQYGWPADSSALRDLPEAQRYPLLEYRRLVMAAFKGDALLTPERLSKFSWQALEQALAHSLADLPLAVKAPLTQALWKEIKSKLSRTWSTGKQTGSQALFFLPDFIRFTNSGDPLPLISIAGMTVGDHLLVSLLGRLRTTTVNTVHKNFLFILKRLPPIPGVSIGMLTGHANNIAKMLYRIPILSPLFAGLTLYSIVDLSQQLHTLPAGSVEQQAVISELMLQSTALVLIVGGSFLGAASGPLWAIFTTFSLLVGAENLRQTQQLNVSIWKALGFSFGFYHDELQMIYQARDLVALNLALANRLSTSLNSTHPTLGWVIVKIPRLDTGEWRNISINKVPGSIQQTINHQASEEPFPHVGSHQYIEAGSFRRLNIFSIKNTLVSSSAPEQGGWKPVRDDLLETYWYQRFYQATPVTTTVQFTAAGGSWERGNNFLSSFPPPWGNYTLESTVSNNLGRNKTEEILVEKKSIRNRLFSRCKSCLRRKKGLPNFVEIDKPWLTPSESLALYTDKRTFSHPTAQRAVYFFFDPREGDSQLKFSEDGLTIWDRLNQQHNSSYFPAQETRDYRLTVQIGHKAYADAIIFPSRERSKLSVADQGHRISSRYFIQTGHTVPFEVIDEAAVVDIIFLDNQTVNTTIRSLFLCQANFQIEVAAPAQKSNFITLLGNKTHVGLRLSAHHTIDHLQLSAQQVEIFNAHGKNQHSRIVLEDPLATFRITINADIIVDSGDVFSFRGTVADNSSGILYSKLFNSTELTLYQLQLPPELEALKVLLPTLRHPGHGILSFHTLELYFVWTASHQNNGTKVLSIPGQLDQHNATLTLQDEQSTLLLFSDPRQPDLLLVEHHTAQAQFEPSLRLLRAEKNIQLAQLFLTKKEEGLQVRRGLELLATLPDEGQGAVLIFQSPQGYPEIHRFPNDSITLNGIHYQVKSAGKLYAIGALEGRITGDQLLRYDDSAGRLVGVHFPTPLHESQLALDNKTLSVNKIQLDQLPGQTLLYFGPMDRPEIVPLQALQDTWLRPSEQPEEILQGTPHPHRHHHQRRHRRQIPDVPSSAPHLTPWTTQLFKAGSHLLSILNAKVHYYLSALLPAGESTSLNSPSNALPLPNRTVIVDEYSAGHLQGLLQLIDLGVRKWTGRNYPKPPLIPHISWAEVSSLAGECTDNFYQILYSATRTAGVGRFTVNPALHQLKLEQQIAHQFYAGQPQAIEKILQSATKKIHQILCDQATRKQADKFMAHFNRNYRSHAVDMKHLQQQWVSFPTHHSTAPVSCKADNRNSWLTPQLPIRPVNRLN